ncbi:MAG: hypothetical protein AAGA56_10855, partial [Myxococcota bacterium]
MNPAFSHALRVLICSSCGASLNVSLVGGEIICDTCGARHKVAPRRDPTSSRSDRDEAYLHEVRVGQSPQPPPIPVDLHAVLEPVSGRLVE